MVWFDNGNLPPLLSVKYCSHFADKETEAEREMEVGRDRQAQRHAETGMLVYRSAPMKSSWAGHVND